MLRLLVVICMLFPFTLAAQTPTPREQDVTLKVSFCDLARDPAKFDKQRIEITTFVKFGFENFQLEDPECDTNPYLFGIWVTYGGKTPSGAIYCCPGEGGTAKRAQLRIDGIEIPLVRDGAFRDFSRLLRREGETVVYGTFQGRFFRGYKVPMYGPEAWGGYGHLGCCSLFVLERVVTFDPHNRKDVDYTEGLHEPGKVCANNEHGTPVKEVFIGRRDAALVSVLKQQNSADRGERSWAFSDPDRVARENFESTYPGSTFVIEVVKRETARRVYRGKWQGKTVIVVISRPYWLTYFAEKDKSVWVATFIHEFNC